MPQKVLDESLRKGCRRFGARRSFPQGRGPRLLGFRGYRVGRRSSNNIRKTPDNGVDNEKDVSQLPPTHMMSLIVQTGIYIYVQQKTAKKRRSKKTPARVTKKKNGEEPAQREGEKKRARSWSYLASCRHQKCFRLTCKLYWAHADSMSCFVDPYCSLDGAFRDMFNTASTHSTSTLRCKMAV